MRRILIVVVTLAASVASAQEIGLFAGATSVVGTNDSSYAWSIQYRQRMASHLQWSFSWLNEGHPTGHHRDGFAPQLWITDTVLSPRFSLGLGVGPYRFFDTVRGADGGSVDLGGWGAALSVLAGWELTPRTTLQLQAVRTYADRDIETHLYLLGLGWRLRRSPPALVPAPNRPGEVVQRTVEREAVVFAGSTILNSFHDRRSTAWGLQYRHGIGAHTDWTVSFINEGETRVTDRDGVAAQIWAENGFSHERLLLGVGVGPYLYDDKTPTEDRPRRGVAAVVSLTAGWRISDHLVTRLIWNRVASFYNRDADVIVLGVGVCNPGG